MAEACNGMRMVFALVLVSYAFAYSMPLRNTVRILVLIAVAAGIYWAATTYLVHSAGGYTKAEAAVQQQAASRGLPSNNVRCGQSGVQPSSRR